MSGTKLDQSTNELTEAEMMALPEPSIDEIDIFDILHDYNLMTSGEFPVPQTDALVREYRTALEQRGFRFDALGKVQTDVPDKLNLSIIHAVHIGCTNSRQIAEYLKLPLSTINNRLYHSNGYTGERLVNGQYIHWTPGKVNSHLITDAGRRLALARYKGVLHTVEPITREESE